MEREVSPTPTLYNLAKLCQPFLGMWNVRGINDTRKREEVVDIFKEGKFDIFALTETKLKVEGEVSWCEVNGIISCVMEMA